MPTTSFLDTDEGKQALETLRSDRLGAMGPGLTTQVPSLIDIDRPSAGETFTSLFRRETLIHDMTTSYADRANYPSKEEIEEDSRDFNPHELFREAAKRPEAYFLSDPENELSLLGTETRLHFQQTLDQMYDEYHDREVIENSSLAVVLPMSLGISVVDVPSALVGFVAGSAFRAGVNVTKAAKRGASLSYTEAATQRAAKVRYLKHQNVNPETPIGISRRVNAATKVDELTAEMQSMRRWTMGSGAVDAAASAGSVELALLDQPGRTQEEMLANIFGSVALSGLLSGGAAAYGGMFAKHHPGISPMELARARAGVDGMVRSPDSVNPIGAADTVRPPKGSPEATIDASPKFIDESTGVLPATVDAVLRTKYKMDGKPSEVDLAGYVQERARIAKEYTGVEATIPMKILRALHPGLRMKTSELTSIRDIAGGLIDADYMESGAHINGRVRDTMTVESRIKLDEAETLSNLNLLMNKAMRTILAKGAEPGSAYKKPGLWAEWRRKNITGRNDQFAAMQAEVTRYINSPDTYVPAPMFRGMEVEIKGIAEDLRTEIFAKWEEIQLEQGMLKKADIPEGMAFYMHRVWDLKKIDENPAKLEAILTEQFIKDRAASRLKEATQTAMDAKEPTLPEGLTPEVLAKIQEEAVRDARDFIESIRGHPLHIASSEVPGGATPASLKKRSPIKSEVVMDFLDMNLGKNMAAWIKNVSPEARLREKFGTNYDVTIREQVELERAARLQSLGVLEQHYKASGDKKGARAVVKERKRINRSADRDGQDIENTIKVLRNEFGAPDDPDAWYAKMGKLLRAWNFMTKLGGMTLSSMVDPAYLITKVGLGTSIRAMGHGLGGWPSVRRGYNTLESEYRSRGTKEFQEYRNDAHMLGIVGELVSHSRADQLAMVADPGELGSKLDDAIAIGTATFSKMTLMSRWNDWMKSTAHMAYTMRIERALMENDLVYLADVGINERWAGHIKSKWAQQGTRQTGATPDGDTLDFVAPNMRSWHIDDPDIGKGAQDLMRNTLRRLVDSTIVGPGVGDVPFAMRRPLGKLIFQFQAFPLAVMSRVIIPAMQRSMPKSGAGWHKRALQTGFGLTTSVLFGSGVYGLKTAFREGPEATKEQLAEGGLDRALLEGIERSGIFGVYQTVLNLADDLTDRQLSKTFADITPWGADGEDLELGYTSRDPMVDSLSVSVSTFKDMDTAISGLIEAAIAGEDMSWGTGSAMRRMTPGNNLFMLQYFNKWVQEHTPIVKESEN